MLDRSASTRRKPPNEYALKWVGRDESKLYQAILKWLKGYAPDVYAYKVWGGPHAHVGALDLTGAVRGRRFEIETKIWPNKATPKQEAEIAYWHAAGVTAFVAYSLEDAVLGLRDLFRDAGIVDR